MIQVYLQRQQLRQNLFDKRFKVYTETSALISVMHSRLLDRTLFDAETVRFAHEVAHHPFLFGSDVAGYLWKLTVLAFKLSDFQLQVQSTIGGENPNFQALTTLEDFPNLFSKLNDIRIELDEAARAQNHVFGPYLTLYHEQGWAVRLKRRIDIWMETQAAALDARYRS